MLPSVRRHAGLLRRCPAIAELRRTLPIRVPQQCSLLREAGRYVLGSYRTVLKANSTRLTSLKSTRFDNPANSVGPWPASVGCTTNSYSSIKPSSANASGSFTPPTNSPLPDSRLRR